MSLNYEIVPPERFKAELLIQINKAGINHVTEVNGDLMFPSQYHNLYRIKFDQSTWELQWFSDDFDWGSCCWFQSKPHLYELIHVGSIIDAMKVLGVGKDYLDRDKP